MMKHKLNPFLSTVVAVLVSFAFGCSKEEAEAPAPPVPPPELQPAQPGAQSAALAPAAPDSRLAESQRALAAQEYDKAVEAMVALNQARLSDQQAAAAAAQMRQLQKSLADAVASGDLRAKAAAERLRGSEMSW